MRSADLSRTRNRAALLLGAVALLCLLLVLPSGARAAGAELAAFQAVRSDEGVVLNYALDFDLPRGAEEALNKAVPLYFVAEAEVFRERWYWRDKRVASALRVWRIVFQPL